MTNINSQETPHASIKESHIMEPAPESEFQRPDKHLLIYIRKHRNDKLPENLTLISRTVKYALRSKLGRKHQSVLREKRHKKSESSMAGRSAVEKAYKLEINMVPNLEEDNGSNKQISFDARRPSESKHIKAINLNHLLPPINYGNKLD